MACGVGGGFELPKFWQFRNFRNVPRNFPHQNGLLQNTAGEVLGPVSRPPKRKPPGLQPHSVPKGDWAWRGLGLILRSATEGPGGTSCPWTPITGVSVGSGDCIHIIALCYGDPDTAGVVSSVCVGGVSPRLQSPSPPPSRNRKAIGPPDPHLSFGSCSFLQKPRERPSQLGLTSAHSTQQTGAGGRVGAGAGCMCGAGTRLTGVRTGGQGPLCSQSLSRALHQ